MNQRKLDESILFARAKMRRLLEAHNRRWLGERMEEDGATETLHGTERRQLDESSVELWDSGGGFDGAEPDRQAPQDWTGY